jgi:hypothetical protein
MYFECAIPMNIAYAYTVEVGQEPELAPLSGRENSLRTSKKIWGEDWRGGVAIATCESGMRQEWGNRSGGGCVRIGMVWEAEGGHGQSEVGSAPPPRRECHGGLAQR